LPGMYELKKSVRNFVFLFQSSYRNLIYFLIISNLAGTLYGFYYYKYQLMNSSIIFWPLITDCPNASLFFSVSAILIVLGKKKDGFSYFAASNMFKYGVWTMVTLLYHSDYFFSPERWLLYSGIFVTHFILLMESIPVAATIEKISLKGSFFTLSWLLFNDFSDYILDTPPYIPERNLDIVVAYTFSLTFVSMLAVYFIHSRIRKINLSP
jgi:uncharacterized membrane protein YpjA